MPRKPVLKKQTITVIVNGAPVTVVLHPPDDNRKAWYVYWSGAKYSRSTGTRRLDEAVVIEVPRGHAHAVTGMSLAADACFLGDVGEFARAKITVEAVELPGLRAVDRDGLIRAALETTAVDEENVEQPVVVVVEEGDASAHGLDEVFFGLRAGLVLEVETGFGAAVFKGRRLLGWGWHRAKS